MKTFLIINNNNEIVSSYQAEEKDETSNYRSYLYCPPHAHHYELPSHLDKDFVKFEYGTITPEQTIILQNEVLFQAEVLVQDEVPEVLDTDGVTVLSPAIPAILPQPEIPFQAAIIEVIPATLGLRFVEDSAKILINRQNKANNILNQIRNLRTPLLEAIDKKINIAEDDGLDVASLRTYRKELRNCTESLKKVNGDAKLTCENIIANEFIFPSLGI